MGKAAVRSPVAEPGPAGNRPAVRSPAVEPGPEDNRPAVRSPVAEPGPVDSPAAVPAVSDSSVAAVGNPTDYYSPYYPSFHKRICIVFNVKITLIISMIKTL